MVMFGWTLSRVTMYCFRELPVVHNMHMHLIARIHVPESSNLNAVFSPHRASSPSPRVQQEAAQSPQDDVCTPPLLDLAPGCALRAPRLVSLLSRL
jgi:hypothetical protein